MEKEYYEEIKYINDIQTKMFEIEKSYITKEEFIDMISNIDFKRVKTCELSLITGFIYDGDENEIKPLYKRIELS